VRKSKLLFVVFVFLFFMLGVGTQCSFAGCTTQNDLTGTDCRDSTDCANPCNGVDDGGDGGIQPLSKQADPLPRFPKLPHHATESPSASIDFGWLNIQGLLMYHRSPVATRVDRISYLDTQLSGFARGRA
jgi:hypothetical protein